MPPISKPANSAYIIINPVAGFTNGDLLKRACEHEFFAAGWQTRFHFTQKNEDLDQVIRQEIAADEMDLVVAAGGDGTIAAVAAALNGTNIPLGIIPTGTWNAIARHLRIPALPQRAIRLMTGQHTLRKLDMMDLGDSIHAMNLGVGFSADMVRNSDREQKRRNGNIAYFANFFKQLFGLQMQRYEILADGIRYKGRATEIFVANYGVVGLRFIEDRLNIAPDDGKVDILVLRARTILDVPLLIWDVFIKREKRTPKYRLISACKDITITTKPPIAVQADGEPLGLTPVHIRVLPQSIRVIAP
jgi:YegS/Rv2252/BmrU family lipid kinase